MISLASGLVVQSMAEILEHGQRTAEILDLFRPVVASPWLIEQADWLQPTVIPSSVGFQ